MTTTGPSPSAPAPAPDLASEPELERLRAALAAVRAELHACQESHERNRACLWAIADGIGIVDTTGLVTCLNPVASHLIGCKEEDCLGRPLDEVVQFIDHQGCAVDVLADGFRSDPDAIVSLVRRDGHVILVDGAVSPVHAPDNRVLGTVINFRNVTASTKLARELAYHANHDTMTGLHNRRAFQARLQRAIVNAAKFGSNHALLYLDLDQFKMVNDSGGHVAGDELLRRLAVLLRRQLREQDTVARMGGDEFAVLLENCTPPDAAKVAEKIRNAVVDFAFAWGGGEFRIGTSIGLVDFSDGARSMEALIECADSMCYVAKDRGRNCVAIHGAEGTPTLPADQDVSNRPGARRVDPAVSGTG